MREMRTIGTTFSAQIKVYENCKYTAHSLKDLGQTWTAEYHNIKNWEIVSGEDAKEIEENDLVDEFHEYLVLHFADGTEGTFRNSHVDMFRI